MASYGNGKLLAATSPAMSTALTLAGAGLDTGSCCAVTKDLFNSTSGIGVIGAALGTFNVTPVSGTAGKAGASNVSEACVPFKAGTITSATPSTVTPTGWDIVTTATLSYSNWWCSNGLYRYVTATTAGVVNNTQPLLGSQNQR